MAQIYVYNTAQSQYEIVDQSREGYYTELGWIVIDKSDLAALWNPSLGVKGHRIVHRSEVSGWQAKGYVLEPTVVYHPEQGEKTVSAEEANLLLKDGWYDSPAKFPAATTEAIVEAAVKKLKKGE